MTTTKKSSPKTKKLSLLKAGDKFLHTTAKTRDLPAEQQKKVVVEAVPVREQLAKRGKLASKNGCVIKTRVKTGPNAGKDRGIIEYRFNGGTVNSRYADLDEVVTLAA